MVRKTAKPNPMAGYPAMYQQPHRSKMQKFTDLFGGRKEERQFIPQYTPQQMALQNKLGGLGGQAAQQMYPQVMNQDPYAGFDQLFQPSEGFNQFWDPQAEQARGSFYEQMVPTLAERFTSMGEGAQRSSAFPQLLGSAGAGFERDLMAQRANQMQQWGQNKMGFGQNNMAMQGNFLNTLLGQGMTQQFQPTIRPGTAGLLSDAGTAAMKMLPLAFM